MEPRVIVIAPVTPSSCAPLRIPFPPRKNDVASLDYLIGNTVYSAIASPYSSGDHSDYSAFLARQRIAIYCRRIIEDNPLRMVVSRITNVADGLEPSSPL